MTIGELDQRKDAFLRAFVQYRRVNKAAEAAGISVTAHYSWLKTDEAYVEAFASARGEIIDDCEAEALRRANGYEEVKIVRKWNRETGEWEHYEETTIRKHSDALLAMIMKANKSDLYGDKSKTELSGPGGEPLKTVSIEFVKP